MASKSKSAFAEGANGAGGVPEAEYMAPSAMMGPEGYFTKKTAPYSSLPFDPKTAVPVELTPGQPIPRHGEVTGTIETGDSQLITDKPHAKAAEQPALVRKKKDVSFFMWNGKPVLPHDTHDENGNELPLTEQQKLENEAHLADFRKLVSQQSGEKSTDPVQAARDELNRALANRSSIVQTIQRAREEGDLKENAGYDAAKNEQARNEARIVELQKMVETGQAYFDSSGNVTSSNLLDENAPLAVGRRRALAEVREQDEKARQEALSSVGRNFSDIMSESRRSIDFTRASEGTKPFDVPAAPEGIRLPVWNKIIEHHRKYARAQSELSVAKALVAKKIPGAQGLVDNAQSAIKTIESSPIASLSMAFSDSDQYNNAIEIAKKFAKQESDRIVQQSDIVGRAERLRSLPVSPEEQDKQLLKHLEKKGKNIAVMSPGERVIALEKAQAALEKTAQREAEKEAKKKGARTDTFASEYGFTRSAGTPKEEDTVEPEPQGLSMAEMQQDEENDDKIERRARSVAAEKLAALPANHPVFDELQSHFSRVDKYDYPSEIPASQQGQLREILKSKMDQREVEAKARPEAIARVADRRVESLKQNLEPIVGRKDPEEGQTTGDQPSTYGADGNWDPKRLDPMKHAVYRVGKDTFDAYTNERLTSDIAGSIPSHFEISTREHGQIRGWREDEAKKKATEAALAKKAEEDKMRAERATYGDGTAVATKKSKSTAFTEGAARVAPRPEDVTPIHRLTEVGPDGKPVVTNARGEAVTGGSIPLERFVPDGTVKLTHPDTGEEVNVTIKQGRPVPTGDAEQDAKALDAYIPYAAEKHGEFVASRKVSRFASRYNEAGTIPEAVPGRAAEEQPKSEIDAIADTISQKGSSLEGKRPAELLTKLETAHATMTTHLAKLVRHLTDSGDLETRRGTRGITVTTPSEAIGGGLRFKNPNSYVAQQVTDFQSKLAESKAHMDSARKIYEGSQVQGPDRLNPSAADEHIKNAAVTLGRAYDSVDIPELDHTAISESVNVKDLADHAIHATANLKGLPHFHSQGDPFSYLQTDKGRLEKIQGLAAAKRLHEMGQHPTGEHPMEISLPNGQTRTATVDLDNLNVSAAELDKMSKGTLRVTKSVRQRFSTAMTMRGAGSDVLRGGGTTTPTEYHEGPNPFVHPDKPGETMILNLVKKNPKLTEAAGGNDRSNFDVVPPHNEEGFRGAKITLTDEQKAENDLHRRAFAGGQAVSVNPMNPLGTRDAVEPNRMLERAASTINASSEGGTRLGSQIPRGVDVNARVPSQRVKDLTEGLRAATSLGLDNHAESIAKELKAHEEMRDVEPVEHPELTKLKEDLKSAPTLEEQEPIQKKITSFVAENGTHIPVKLSHDATPSLTAVNAIRVAHISSTGHDPANVEGRPAPILRGPEADALAQRVKEATRKPTAFMAKYRSIAARIGGSNQQEAARREATSNIAAGMVGSAQSMVETQAKTESQGFAPPRKLGSTVEVRGDMPTPSTQELSSAAQQRAQKTQADKQAFLERMMSRGKAQEAAGAPLG